MEHNNDIDNHVDNDIFTALDPNNLKSFFLFAGAGSGKTRTLVNVLNNFKETYGKSFKLRNHSIAIITYTNAAADEINHRLEYNSLFKVSTIHSFCWDLIGDFTVDIKAFLAEILQNDIKKLEEEQSKSRDLTNKTSVTRAIKIESKKKRIGALKSIHKFVYNPNGDNITKASLNHSEVIDITSNFINNKTLFQKILIQKFPIILIDESQDTKKGLIKSLFDLELKNIGKFSLGLLGDTMQRIYSDGEESLGKKIPSHWIQPIKKMNHRSKSRIIDLVNKIRLNVDNQEQIERNDKIGGFVRFYIVHRDSNKTNTELLIKEKMYKLTNDEKWSGTTEDIKTLTLEHHMAAIRMGFATFFNPLYEHDKTKTSILEGTNASVNLFTKTILPLSEAYRKKNLFEIANIIKKNSKLLSKETLELKENKIEYLKEVNDKVNQLLALWDNNQTPIVIDVLIKIEELNLFEINTELSLLIKRNKLTEKNPDSDILEKDDDLIIAWENALQADFNEIKNYHDYISENSPYGTHQGVKGLEFDRVMVIIDDDEARGFMFNYDKLFGVKEKTKTDLENIAKGIETGIDRTRRLFYVACSRAKESLAIVAYTNNPDQLKENVIDFKWFTQEEIETIN